MDDVTSQRPTATDPIGTRPGTTASTDTLTGPPATGPSSDATTPERSDHPGSPLPGGAGGDGGAGGEPPDETPDPSSEPSRARETGVRAVLGFVGRGLITLGLLVLLFVAYQLWGTGLYEARAQNELEGDFEKQLEQVEASAPETDEGSLGGGEGEGSEPVPASAFTEGEAALKIEIPDAGVDRIVVQGITIPDLRKGPGHYPDTPMPGEVGNAAIAGHRTTYGQPFHNLDKLEPGDEITATTLNGTYVYDVIGTEIVAPTAVDVLKPPGKNTYVGKKARGENALVEGDAMLTLTTCNPKYSAAERLVVFAELNPSKSPEAQPPTVSANLSTGRATIDSAGLSGEESSRTPALIFALIVAAVGALWWLAFRRWRHWYTWFAGVIPFLAVLFVFYTYIERMLPGNY